MWPLVIHTSKTAESLQWLWKLGSKASCPSRSNIVTDDAVVASSHWGTCNPPKSRLPEVPSEWCPWKAYYGLEHGSQNSSSAWILVNQWQFRLAEKPSDFWTCFSTALLFPPVKKRREQNLFIENSFEIIGLWSSQDSLLDALDWKKYKCILWLVMQCMLWSITSGILPSCTARRKVRM